MYKTIASKVYIRLSAGCIFGNKPRYVEIGGKLCGSEIKWLRNLKFCINIFETRTIAKHNARYKELQDCLALCLPACMITDALIVMIQQSRSNKQKWGELNASA